MHNYIIEEALSSLRKHTDKKPKFNAFELDSLNESLENEKLNEKVENSDKLANLWDQVFSSLFDSGANQVYTALGDLNGKNHYDNLTNYGDPDSLGSKGHKSGCDTIFILSDDIDWAKHIADVYGLESEIIPNQGICLFIPEEAPLNPNLLTDEGKEKLFSQKLIRDKLTEVAKYYNFNNPDEYLEIEIRGAQPIPEIWTEETLKQGLKSADKNQDISDDEKHDLYNLQREKEAWSEHAADDLYELIFGEDALANITEDDRKMLYSKVFEIADKLAKQFKR